MLILDPFSGALSATAPITAVVYDNRAQLSKLFAELCDQLSACGIRLAGLIQRDLSGHLCQPCDMVLEDLASGERTAISLQRGPLARGCKLALGSLLMAGEKALTALQNNPDLVVINKFGKCEAEGGGLRPLIWQAVLQGVPVLIAVPVQNLQSWEAFSQGFANTIAAADLQGIASPATADRSAA